MEVGDLAREPPDLPRQRREHRPAQRGLGVDQAVERVAPEHKSFGRPDRDRGRGPRPAVEQGELPEEPASPQGREDDRLRSLLGRQHDLDLSAGDDEQRVTGVLDVEDDLAAAEAPTAHRVGTQSQRRIVEPGEQGTRVQRLARQGSVGNGTDHALHRTRWE